MKKVPAYLYTPERDDIRKVKFLITTELVDSIVLLRIDDAWPDDLIDFDTAAEQMELMYAELNGYE